MSDIEGKGCADISTAFCRWSIPPLFVIEIASSKHRGHEIGTLAHASISGMIILS